MPVERVVITAGAAEIVRALRGQHGELLFHQSAGCCDGSAPMCYPRSEFRIGQQDVYLGSVEDCPVYTGAAQFEYWKYTQIVIDVVPGRGSGFSLEAPMGVRFLTRSRLFTDKEAAELERVGPPARGDMLTSADLQ